jgi:hypothetical protein
MFHDIGARAASHRMVYGEVAKVGERWDGIRRPIWHCTHFAALSRSLLIKWRGQHSMNRRKESWHDSQKGNGRQVEALCKSSQPKTCLKPETG